MIYLYTVNIDQLYDLYENHRDIFEGRMSLLCPERQKKVREMKQPKDKVRAMGAGLLLQIALQNYLLCSVAKKDAGHRQDVELKRQYSFTEEELQWARQMRHLDIAYEEQGKPYLPEYPGIFFSLSHSGDYVALALSSNPVGVDIQERKELSQGVVERFFTEEEKQSEALPFQIFSGKESYVKFTGEGVSRSFTDFTVNLAKKTVTEGEQILAYVRSRELEDGAYILCVCDRNEDIISYAGD